MKELITSCCLLYFVVFLFFGQAAFAQSNCRFIYRETMGVTKDALLRFSKDEMLKLHVEAAARSGDSLSTSEEAIAMALVKSLDSGFADTSSYSLAELFIEGKYVVNRDLKKPPGSTIIKKFSLLNGDLTVIDSFTFRKMDSVSVSVYTNSVLTPGKYSILKTGQQKILQGYKCEKIIITEVSGQDGVTGMRHFEIWATRQIKPALPVYGVLQLQQKILEAYTPLLYTEYLDASKTMFSQSIITEIHCPQRAP